MNIYEKLYNMSDIEIQLLNISAIPTFDKRNSRIYILAYKVTLKFMYMQIAVLYQYKYKSENEQNI